MNRQLAKALTVVSLISSITLLGGCSPAPKQTSQVQAKTQLCNLHTSLVDGQIPTVRLNGEVMLGNTAQIQAGFQSLKIKHYVDNARPIIEDLSFQAKNGRCYALSLQNDRYLIIGLGKCDICPEDLNDN